ncbi:MAG: class I SAM-dependent methyltransferase [Neisseria sp.]|uniref:O-methyltransferase n=1 Tax=Neisseria sp. TaxID=192066 RepID=UPI0026DDC0FD|nr:class I SAM-dependent methyltransferase [Neisseria sp.]MDO4640793.1 class I SAM-dependent methyltransferase [Neisseria sp.]
MAKLKPEMFAFLHELQAEATLWRLYEETLKQSGRIFLHFLPKIFHLMGKGINWRDENECFYEDKYIPIDPRQGAFLYMQAMATGARNIVEFGTSYGISTLYLAAAAKRNGGKVITCEYLPHKAEAARRHFAEAGLSDFIELREGDALQTLQELDIAPDFVLLDGWPNLVYPVFQILEPRLADGAVIAVDDVAGFQPSMQDYLDYIRNPANGYVSATLHPGKAMEYSVKRHVSDVSG